MTDQLDRSEPKMLTLAELAQRLAEHGFGKDSPQLFLRSDIRQSAFRRIAWDRIRAHVELLAAVIQVIENAAETDCS